MNAPTKLEAFASDPNWMSFAKALMSALETPEAYNFVDGNQLLAAVALLRGVDASSLRNPLAAVSWMKTHAPEALEAENDGIAMTGVLLLSQISFYDNKLAASLATKFFGGELSRTQIREALKGIREKKGGRGILAHERVKQAVAFEAAVAAFLNNNPDVLELGSGISITEGTRSSRVPVDFAVLRNGKPIAAIEVKSYRQKRHQRYLLETLGMAALAAREHSKTVLVLPESWGSSVDLMTKLIEDLKIADVKIAIFKDGDGVGNPGEFYYVFGSW
ncbi:hypothetical protein [uncultured Sulfitobacter sp.]|uniref:hypothetical protein n=1 Tax=uncultured Sulfitobacter sp. TaxID=191468 RepID=UPI0030DDC95E|tara:strand:+ start:572 stop:1399 length:828 start_codon:yes stop_codon:yes gene_type:complete